MNAFVRRGQTAGVMLGPFISASDGKTPVNYTSLTLGSIACTVHKGITTVSVTLSASNLFQSSTTTNRGYYKFTATTDQPGTTALWDTAGPVVVTCSLPAQHLFVRNEFIVLHENIYDWIFGSTNTVGTIETLVKAMMNKTASAPSGVGTFSPSTDSVEAIRDYLVAEITPNLVGGASLSGSGFLADSVSMIRQLTDESGINAKYTDGDLLTYLRGSMATVIADMNANTDHPLVARASLAIVVDKQVYHLPCQVSKLYSIAKINTTTGLKEWEVRPGTRWDFSGQGFVLEGNTIRLLSKWKAAYTLEYEFVPDGEPHPHKGTCAQADYTTTTLKLAATPLDGTLDTRPNSYAGYIVRILSSSDSVAVYTQERVITAHNNQTRVITVGEAFSPALVGTVTYEVLPRFGELLKQVWALHTAMTILGIEGQEKKFVLTERLYQGKLRALRLQLRKEFRVGQVFEGQMPENPLTWGGNY